MRIPRIIFYIIYVVSFSLVCTLASELQAILSVWSLGHSLKSIYSISELIHHFPQHVFFAILQVIAAILTIRQLSLSKLFFLSCVFAIIGALMTGLELQIMKVSGWLSFVFFPAGGLIPYIAPVFILALINRKKTVPETSSDVEKETISTLPESEVSAVNKTKDKIKSLYSRYWYIFDIFLIVLVLLYGTLNDPFGLVMYVCGLYNQMIIRAFMLFIWVFWLVPAALCLLVLLLRMIISWPKYIKKKRRLLLLRLFIIISLGIYLIPPFTPFRPHGFNVYIKGFRKYIEAKADITAIRGWLEILKPEDCVEYNIVNASDGSRRSSPKWLQKQAWPNPIESLKPVYVILSLDDDKRPKVRLNWGSGFLGSWGLVVGNEKMLTPESDLSHYGEYRQEISKGVYVWYEIQ